MTGADLKARRTALGLSQRQLAEALGMSRRTWEGWEMGRRDVPFPTMLDLALAQLEQRRRPGGGALYYAQFRHKGGMLVQSGKLSSEDAARRFLADATLAGVVAGEAEVLPCPEGGREDE